MKIKIKVKPNSSISEVEKIDNLNYFVKLKSQPEDNKANIELIRILAKYFNTDYHNIKIKSGKTLRNKVIEII